MCGFWHGHEWQKKAIRLHYDFLGTEFDIILMKARLPKNKLIKTIEQVTRILEKKSSTPHKELQSLVGLLSFVAKVVLVLNVSVASLYYSHVTHNISL